MRNGQKGTDDGLTVFRQGDYIGLRDGNGNISLSPDLRFVLIEPIVGRSGVYIAKRNDAYSLVDGQGNCLTGDYDRIEHLESGYYRVRRRHKYNVIDEHDKPVLSSWMHHIGEMHKGFFVISVTERKTASSPTRRMYGLAHVDGTIVFSPIFEKLIWREHSFFYAEKDDHPYIIKEDGSIIDLTFEHLPVRLEVDQKVFVEKALDWILSGMQIYYRDSEANIDATKMYEVGKIIRAGFFIDVSTRLQRPVTKLRFLICSAHVAPWEAINELVVDNPNIGIWGFCTLHCNSYYIVLDVYKKGDVTQVALLHIPPAVAKNIGDSAPELLKIVKKLTTDKGTLVDITRRLLDHNLRLHRDKVLDDEYLKQCMRHPIGLNNVYEPVGLEPAKLKGDAAALGRLVSRLAKDGDINDFYTGNLIDNFLWHGLNGSVCEGCIYTKGIVENYRGCGRLTTGSFRRNYMRGHCEYRKPDISVYSQAELDAKHRWSKYQENVEKTSHVYAKNLVRRFITEQLGGDIDKLINFDFSRLSPNSRFVDNMSTLAHTPIIRALMSLIYNDTWGDITYDLIERGDFVCDTLHSTEQQLGSPVATEYFLGLHNLQPTPQQNFEAFELHRLTNTLGNFWLLPNRGGRTTFAKLHDNAYYNGFIVQFVRDLYGAMKKDDNASAEMREVLHDNSKMFNKYRGAHGFRRLMQSLMLDDLLDANFVPSKPYDSVTWRNPGTAFFDNLAACHDFFAMMLPRRSARMVAKLKQSLNN